MPLFDQRGVPLEEGDVFVFTEVKVHTFRVEKISAMVSAQESSAGMTAKVNIVSEGQLGVMQGQVMLPVFIIEKNPKRKGGS